MGLLQEYSDVHVFVLTDSELGCTDIVRHSIKTGDNECTKVQNPRRQRVRESLNACVNAGKARAIETQSWLCTLLEAL